MSEPTQTITAFQLEYSERTGRYTIIVGINGSLE